MPDIFIRSVPEITFIQFVCSFGGLMGMWLGISILVIFDDICKIIILFISNPNVINLNNCNIYMMRSTIGVRNQGVFGQQNATNCTQNSQINPIFIKYQ